MDSVFLSNTNFPSCIRLGQTHVGKHISYMVYCTGNDPYLEVSSLNEGDSIFLELVGQYYIYSLIACVLTAMEIISIHNIIIRNTYVSGVPYNINYTVLYVYCL